MALETCLDCGRITTGSRCESCRQECCWFEACVTGDAQRDQVLGNVAAAFGPGDDVMRGQSEGAAAFDACAISLGDLEHRTSAKNTTTCGTSLRVVRRDFIASLVPVRPPARYRGDRRREFHDDREIFRRGRC